VQYLLGFAFMAQSETAPSATPPAPPDMSKEASMKQAVLQAFKPYTRIGNLILALCAFLGAAGSLGASAKKVKTQPVIRVVVYNYADVPRLELRVAERQAADLFAGAGNRIVWLHFAVQKHLLQSSSDSSTPDLFLRILNASAISRVRRISRAELMGEAFVSSKAEGPVQGRIANVFYDRAKHVSTLWGLNPGQVLGDFIAHELGHLLLGARHSRKGIMKADWTSRDLKLASRGQLQFLPAQGALIQLAAQTVVPRTGLNKKLHPSVVSSAISTTPIPPPPRFLRKR
jgi:hypothetical protein